MKKRTPVAVVGMAGLFPGALDIHTFWQNIINKIETTVDIPADRWIVDPDLMYHPDPMPDRTFSKRACLINDFQFDPKGIDLEDKLLEALDPLHQMVLQTGRKALDHCVTESVNKKNIGVVLAAIALPTDASSSITRKILGKSFEEKLFGSLSPAHHQPISREECLASRVTSFPAAILAEGLGLGGGSFTLDAACASSIYAVKLACDELQHHRSDLMLAGGVSRPECLYTQVGFSQLRALSPSGRCSPFDENADGLVVGEGVGLLTLKRLDDALRDGDEIFATIQGIGLSNDMRGNLLAPDSKGQVRAMRNAYIAAGWSPEDVDLIECHGAGTPVGDVVEIQSMTNLWGESGSSKGECPIGSVKSMIGHLLTAAGAAGMIKTLLALKHQILPPSLNFKKPPADSPLRNGLFRVQTEAEEWKRRDDNTPLRAAVSAFGFGGINSHLLFEEWNPNIEHGRLKSTDHQLSISSPPPTYTQQQSSIPPPSVAVIGMASVLGTLNNLREFQEAVFKGETVIANRPENRWNSCDKVADKYLNKNALWGGFMTELPLYIGELHIPPAEVPDIILQHLLMLKVAVQAMEDAGLPLRKNRPRVGAIIGIDFDFEATDFHQRWNLHNDVLRWKKRSDVNIHVDDEKKTTRWLESLRDEFRPPLTATRTLGALGGIIASRIAREFCFGGPSYVVSNETASGLKALEIGMRSLQLNELDAVLVGAVDLFGDVRSVVTWNQIRSLSGSHNIRPFDHSADGTLPGEGAVALILKRLDKAEADRDRIYAVIKGIGKASSGGVKARSLSKDAYTLSVKRSLQDAGVSKSSISFVECHGSGNPLEDQIELEALNDIFPQRREPCAIGSVKPNIGFTGAASGLASLVKTSLCLYNEIIPPLRNFVTPGNNIRPGGKLHMPAFPQYWVRNRKDGPRFACTAAMTTDGNCMHVILEGREYESYNRIPQKVSKERKRPLGFVPFGLFVVEGNQESELLEGLETLRLHMSNSLNRPDRISSAGKKSRRGDEKIEQIAGDWYRKNKPNPRKKYAVTIVANSASQFETSILEAQAAISAGKPCLMDHSGGACYFPSPLGIIGEVAFVFPGSGNHYIGMGRTLGVQWPDILRRMDAETGQLKSQLIPDCYVPWRTTWETGWESSALEKIVSNPLNMIFGQVAHGGVVADLIASFGVKPDAVIGYSLGESAGLFALKAWPDRGKMLERMLASDLFTEHLAGPCSALRNAWKIPDDENVNWCTAVINRPADMVKTVISKWSLAKLLIVNTPNQCVIGGRRHHVESVIHELQCEAVFLEGVPTVHCDAATPVAEAYKKLHMFPTTPPEGVRFYSCARGRSYCLDSENAANSILEQAMAGFNFTTLIEQAYQDGIRVFLEMGPHASCTGMINSILGKKPHLALSACIRGEDDVMTILKFIGTLIAERVPVDLEKLYGDDFFVPKTSAKLREKSNRSMGLIKIPVGSKTPSPSLPITTDRIPPAEAMRFDSPERDVDALTPDTRGQASNREISEMIGEISKSIEKTAEAHKTFLDFSQELTDSVAKTYSFQTRLLEKVISPKDSMIPDRDRPLLNRDMCLEFATGSVAKVLGPEFAVVDTYEVRVRLPDEPLMLVDRIISVEGEKRSMGSGRIVTEHDVLPGAWYLDGDRVPVCISVEAGQADLFLCSYLGIDHAVKGERSYRLLDATVKFHRVLPRPGDTIRYEIEIDHFVRQGDTYLFFFSFEGFIGKSRLISMFNGCAGFFTKEEMSSSGGIILTEEDTTPRTGKKDPDWVDLVPLHTENYDEVALEALRQGDLAGCFGPSFEGIELAESLRLPGGRMKLIHRILFLDPQGGRYGLGLIRAEADIHPDDWFLTCHFMDDMVMPGTLMYECCAHTLRVFIQRLGWVTPKPGVCYEPVIGVESILKCRGPVTPETKHVWYDLEIKEIGYAPEPFVIANALMYADGHRIVSFKNITMQMTGTCKEDMKTTWKQAKQRQQKTEQTATPALYNRDSILAFAVGKPSKAFGEPYRVFDQERTIARLPGPPYSFLDRIVAIEPKAWELKPDGWITAEYDVPTEAWYFKADRSGSMPFCVLLEIALQSCGWLAAYMGSALRSNSDLKFRNLGGNALFTRTIYPEDKILTIRSRMTKVSEAANMIIEHFEFMVLRDSDIVYAGETYFGFFSQQALGQQIGIREAEKLVYHPAPDELKRSLSYEFGKQTPLSPDDFDRDEAPQLSMPANALLMIDKVDIYVRDGGPNGLGYIRGIKHVKPGEWFFKAHFFQDPVCPGSLGIESFLQLIKFVSLDRWKHLADNHRFELITDKPHNWIYRGQVLPENKKIEVEAVITEVIDTPIPTISANGFLKVDGLYIYQMENFGFRLAPI